MKEFFKQQRRKLQLIDFAPKMNAESEKRIRIDFAMPLTGQPLVGLPDFVSDAMGAVGKVDSGILNAELSAELEGITIELFPHDKAKRREVLLTSCTLRKFSVARPDVKEGTPSDDVTLYFNTTVPGTKEILDYCWDSLGMTVFGEFEQTQPSLDMGAGDEEEGGKKNGKAGKDSKSKAAGDNDDDGDQMPIQPATNRRAVSRL
jgi:hypothetical protein